VARNIAKKITQVDNKATVGWLCQAPPISLCQARAYSPHVTEAPTTIQPCIVTWRRALLSGLSSFSRNQHAPTKSKGKNIGDTILVIIGLQRVGVLSSCRFEVYTVYERGFPSADGYYNDLGEEAAALLESLVNNHAFLDGNKRVGFAAAHAFLLLNGFDLDVSSKAAVGFVMKALAEGKFRFALLHEWIAKHIVPLPG